MEDQLISFETAKLAKEKGFDLPTRYGMHNLKDRRDCFSGLGNYDSLNYNSHNHLYSLPTQSLLQKWLRDIHNIHVAIVGGCFELSEGLFWEIQVGIIGADSNDYEGDADCTYEQALEKGLQEALKLVK